MKKIGSHHREEKLETGKKVYWKPGVSRHDRYRGQRSPQTKGRSFEMGSKEFRLDFSAKLKIEVVVHG